MPLLLAVVVPVFPLKSPERDCSGAGVPNQYTVLGTSGAEVTVITSTRAEARVVTYSRD
jgi:hypothetical protein